MESQDEYSAAVEYLIETDQNESQQDDEDDEHEEISLNAISQEYDINELKDEEKVSDISVLKDDNLELGEPTFLNYDSAINNETISSHQDEIPYQESFVTDAQSESSLQLDSWLSGVKETILVIFVMFEYRLLNKIISNLILVVTKAVESKS